MTFLAFRVLRDLVKKRKVEPQVAAAQEQAANLNRLGVAYHTQGEHQSAQACFQNALALCPEFDDSRYNLGLSLQAAGRLTEAENTLRDYLARHPGNADAWGALGLLLIERADRQAAVQCLQRAVAAAPQALPLRLNLGELHLEMENWQAAYEVFRQLVELQPEHALAHYRLGFILLQLDRVGEAFASLERSMALDGKDTDAPVLAGNAMIGLGRYDDAQRYFTLALERDPRALNARRDLATLHLDMGEFREAAAVFGGTDFGMSALTARRALAMPMFPDLAAEWTAARRNCLNTLNSLAERGLRLARPDLEVGMTNFRFAYHGRENRELHQALAGFYAAICPELAWTAPHIGAGQAAGRMRLGVVSAHLLAEHSVGRIYGGMLEQLSRDLFDITIFHVGKKLPGHRYVGAEKLHSLHLPQDLLAVRSAIADAQLDILIYPDIGMDGLTYFLAFARLAPVQLVLAGHPDTTGIPNIDFYLSFRDIEPENAASHYSESLAMLEQSSLIYPAYRPARNYERADFGLPAGARLYGCLQVPFKFHPDFDAALAEILERDAAAHIVISESCWPRQCRVLTERLRRKLPEQGKRLIVLPHLDFQRYLGLISCCDVLLDTWYFGGGNTIFHGFSVGVPTITWPGPLMRGRAGLFVYKQLGIPDFIADSPDAYAPLAISVAHDAERQHAFRRSVETMVPDMFEQTGGVARFEELLLAARARR